MAKKEDKTNVCRLLEQKKIPHEVFRYETDGALSGVEAAEKIGKDPAMVFKTLVTRGHSGQPHVFMIPAAEELDLKKAAKAVGEKSIQMLPSKELLPLTGYIHGGCSPIGMKKAFPTVIDETALLFDEICFSGGKIGCQVMADPRRISDFVRTDFADLTE